ncbi:MAG: polymerase subunit alpha, partial [Solirubrobacteraceae bacterium]|nr:polymerase subunit alpha [Solirubrobacteraceae bacterium]
TQFSMKPVEQLGLLKMDFLGLRNLDVIEDALDIIERSTGVRPDMTTLPLDDARTYEMLSAGDSIGVFQFESEGMQKALRNVRPSEFDDLVALNALYRPGAMDQIPTYARGKRQPETVEFADERLRPITQTTKGVILYQEQSMQIAKTLAGFSGARADDLRKAIGKKNREAMAKLEPEFREGCRASGTSEQVIEQLWATNVKSADYSFNRSHAACYALIAYRTAWLKANYPAEYMAALISSVMSTKDKVPFFATQAEQMGIEILPPDVNVSDHDFVVSDGNIRFGLDAVKGVGYAAVEAIKTARSDGGSFTSLWDFCARVDARAVNKKAIEALVKCGAFGSTGATRKGMLAVLEQAQAAGQKTQQDIEIGQGSIFDAFDFGGGGAGGNGNGNGAAAAFAAPAHPPIPPEEFEQPELLAIEKESIGLFISAHPLKQVREALRERVDCPLAELAGRKDKDWVNAGGIITAAKKIRTRNGEPMMFATLDDLEGSVEILVFGKALAEYEGALGVDSVVLVRGRVDHKDADKTCLVVQTAEPFEPTPEEVQRAKAAAATRKVGPLPLHLRIHDAARLPASIIDDLKSLIANYPGDCEVVLEVQLRAGDELKLRLGPSYKVAPTPTLRAELEQVLGPAALAV